MIEHMEYLGYSGSVEYDFEDKCFHGRITNIPDFITYEGKDGLMLEAEFQLAVREYIQSKDIL